MGEIVIASAYFTCAYFQYTLSLSPVHNTTDEMRVYNRFEKIMITLVNDSRWDVSTSHVPQFITMCTFGVNGILYR